MPGGYRALEREQGLHIVSQERAATRASGVTQARGNGGRVPLDETPRQRFQRLAPKDVTAAKDAILYIERFRDRRSYDLRQEDVEMIMAVLKSAVDHLAGTLENPDTPYYEITFPD